VGKGGGHWRVRKGHLGNEAEVWQSCCSCSIGGNGMTSCWEDVFAQVGKVGGEAGEDGLPDWLGNDSEAFNLGFPYL